MPVKRLKRIKNQKLPNWEVGYSGGFGVMLRNFKQQHFGLCNFRLLLLQCFFLWAISQTNSSKIAERTNFSCKEAGKCENFSKCNTATGLCEDCPAGFGGDNCAKPSIILCIEYLILLNVLACGALTNPFRPIYDENNNECACDAGWSGFNCNGKKLLHYSRLIFYNSMHKGFCMLF